ncbi:MAG: hypothetical protein KF693_07175 [Nitrospira sp.]|nr:hypothetical protein [Nitrospira sp.]
MSPIQFMMTEHLSHRLSPNALIVLRQRYLAKNGYDIPIESPADMFRRVAKDTAAFFLAHERGCKGLAVYCSGSREHQALSCSHVQSC